MIRERFFLTGAIIAGVILGTISRANADTNRFNLLIDYPPTLQSHFTYTPETPVFGRFQPYVGLQTDYSYRPLRVTDATTLATRPVMNFILAEYLYAAVGIAPRVQVGVVIPFLLQTSFVNPGPVIQPAAEHKQGVSDIRFDAAVNVLGRSKYPVGLSILGFITAPTGPENEFLGNSGVTGGGQVIVDTARWQRLHLSSAIGALFHKKIAFENLNVGPQLEVTTGAAWDFIPTISGTTEFRLRTPFNNFMKNSANTPMEARLGMDWRIGQSGFMVKPGVGFGITYGSSQPLVRGLVAVTYTGVAQPPRPAKEPAPKIQGPEIVHKVAPKVPTPEVAPAKVVAAPKIVAPEVMAPPVEVTPVKVVEAPKPTPTPTPAPEVKVAVPQAPAPEVAPTTPIGDLPYRVKFALGSSKLPANAMTSMDKVLVLLHNPRVTLRIQGHAEPRLSSRETPQLATRRAQVVMRELIRQGVNPARLQVVGLNGWLPAAFPDTRTSHRNIRVDFVALPDLD